MAKTLRAVDGSAARSKALRKLRHISIDTVACRGDHHPWPQLKMRNGKLPRGISAGPKTTDGTRIMRVYCPSCGRLRWKLTGPGGVVIDSRWHYEGGPEDFYQPDLTRADFKAENDRRIDEALNEADRLAAVQKTPERKRTTKTIKALREAL